MNPESANQERLPINDRIAKVKIEAAEELLPQLQARGNTDTDSDLREKALSIVENRWVEALGMYRKGLDGATIENSETNAALISSMFALIQIRFMQGNSYARVTMTHNQMGRVERDENPLTISEKIAKKLMELLAAQQGGR